MNMIRPIFNNIETKYRKEVYAVRFNPISLAVIGCFGFPLYFCIWAFIFPQPYENFTLRIAGSITFILFIIIERLSHNKFVKLRKIVPWYFFISSIFSIPFFFTFMTFKNNFNTVWIASLISSTLYLILIFDILNMVIAFVIGTALGIIAYVLTTDLPEFPYSGFEFLPILVFTLTGAAIHNYNEELIADRNALRMQALAAIGGSIAHEMRTPLLGIRLDAEAVSYEVCELLDVLEKVAENAGIRQPVSLEDRQDLVASLQRIKQQTAFADAVITMMLLNVSSQQIETAGFAVHGMAAVVDQALETYPFRDDERRLVVWERACDFPFRGSDILMRHVLFNLIKNALRALAEADRGVIEIRLEPAGPVNRVLFRDTGAGVAPEIREHLFEPFVTGSRGSGGTGIGLAFCRRVIESFDGSIACITEHGSFTEFVITLPDPPDPRPSC